MTSKLGPYWSVMHRRPQDYYFFERLQPSVFKIMDGGTPDYQFARDKLPNSLVVARDWALSEQHADMLKDPIATGKRHAQEWNAHQQRLGFDKGNTLILGINEPRVWEPGVPEALRRYTIAMCEEASVYGMRVGAMQLSVGWPANTGLDTPPNWEPFRDIDNAIRANHGALICHEYWADNGPQENWGWWAGRSLKCPWDVPLVIGEAGIDMFVKDASVKHETRGWRGRKSPEQYASELAEYVGRMSTDSRFVGCTVFAADYANREWASFDIEPAYNAILATPIPVYPATKPPHEVHLPSVGTGKPTATVTAPAGANIRSGPGLEYDILGAEAKGVPMLVTGCNAEGDWWQVDAPNVGPGWVYGMVVQTANVANVPVVEESAPPSEPPTAGNDWPRIYAFIKRWEGGWADHPHDPGGATNKGITFDTFKRWRASRGQGTPTKDDLRNLTDAEAEQIFYEWYYKASGADQLPWPLNLAQADTAVNAGVGRANEMLQKSRGNFLAYMGHLVKWYASIDNFEHFGRSWMNRRGDMMIEASKS